MQQQKPLEGAQLVIMTIALSLATFMQVLDSTIANVAIPTIAGNLGSSLSQGTWVITSFGVANAISIPITGWLAKRVGEVKLFMWSTVAFAIASWACGVSSSLNMLIFSLLPAQNATGNWIKVVQRLPVRIELDAQQLAQHPLRIGLSTLVTVDTANRDGQVLASQVRTTPVSESNAREISLAPVNKLIEEIVQANAG